MYQGKESRVYIVILYDITTIKHQEIKEIGKCLKSIEINFFWPKYYLAGKPDVGPSQVWVGFSFYKIRKLFDSNTSFKLFFLTLHFRHKRGSF